MVKDKNKQEAGTKEKKKSLIFYINDNGIPTSAYAELLEAGIFVVFKTGDNIIKLPSGRVLKIKEKIKDEY
jgi:hypothetical protein